MHETNLASVDLNLLVVLDALLREPHVRRAGERVGLSQPATSHALARLRALLGDPLLVRAGSAMALTPHAAALRAPLAQMLGIARSVLASNAFSPEQSDRTFTFMMPDLVCDFLGPPLVSEVSRSAPNVKIRFAPWRGPALLTRADLLEVDFLITSLERAFPDFSYEPLYDDHDVTVARKGHPKARLLSRKSTFCSLGHVAVVGAGEAEDVSELWLRSAGLARRVELTVPSYLLALRIAARTDLIAFVPNRLAQAMSKPLGLVLCQPPADPGIDRLRLGCSSRLAKDPAAQWMREKIRSITVALA